MNNTVACDAVSGICTCRVNWGGESLALATNLKMGYVCVTNPINMCYVLFYSIHIISSNFIVVWFWAHFTDSDENEGESSYEDNAFNATGGT